LDFLVDGLYHFLPDELDLLRLGVGGFLLLVLLLFGKGNNENSEVVVVGGFDIDVHVDHGVPFFDHGADFVSGQRHTVEVEHAVFALYVFADKFEFAEGVGAVAVEITLVDVINTSFEAIGGEFVAGRPGDQSFANLLGLEHSWGFVAIPVFFQKGVDDLLFTTFLVGFDLQLVFTYCHFGESKTSPDL